MTYQRVCPRDLFNESKLLKCIGMVSLLIHDNQIKGLVMDDSDCSGNGFRIGQNPGDGSISIMNLAFRDSRDEPVYFSTSLNSRENYPLIMQYKDEEYYPLDENGGLIIDEDLFTKEVTT